MLWNCDRVLPFLVARYCHIDWHHLVWTKYFAKRLCNTPILSLNTCWAICMKAVRKAWFPSWDWRTGFYKTLGNKYKRCFLKKAMSCYLCLLGFLEQLPSATLAVFVHKFVLLFIFETAYTWWRKYSRKKICVFEWYSFFPRRWTSSQNPILKYPLLRIVKFWISKQGNLFDLYKLGIIFQRYLNNISNCHPFALINKWTAQKWF